MSCRNAFRLNRNLKLRRVSTETRVDEQEANKSGLLSMKWIPFKLDQVEAEHVFRQHHSSKWFGENTSIKPSKITRTYLPFYAFQADVESFVTVNLKSDTKRHRLCQTWNAFKGDKGMQVYASNFFHRPFINDIKPDLFLTDLWQDMKPDQQMDSAESSVLAFSLDASTALFRYVSPMIKLTEGTRVEQFLKSKYPDDQNVPYSSFLEWLNCTATPCYFPVYIMETLIGRDTFYTYVDGVVGNASGPRFANPVKIGIATAVTASLCGAFAFPALLSLKTAFIWSLQYFALPYIVGFTATRVVPVVQVTYQEQKAVLVDGFDSRSVQKYDAEQPSPIWWDFQRTIDRFDDFQKKLSEKEDFDKWHEYREHLHATGSFNADSFGHAAFTKDGYANVKHPDPQGYYRSLGLHGREAIVSKQDIQLAFRELASQFHPDKHNNGPDKAEASVRFQEISQAYAVLGKDERRRAYDMLGK